MNSINQQNLEIKELDQKNNKISSDEIQINLDQKTATKDIDKEDSSIKDKENNRDIKISEKNTRHKPLIIIRLNAIRTFKC